MLNNELLRGKIELSIYYELKESAPGYSINQPVVKEYLKQLAEIAGEAGMEETERNLQVAMRLPDAMKSEKDELEKEDSQAAELVKLRFFAGLTHQEAAGALGVTRRVADRLWRVARAWRG